MFSPETIPEAGVKKTRTICAKIVALSMKSAVGMTTDTSYVSSLPTSGTVGIEILAKRNYAQSGEDLNQHAFTVQSSAHCQVANAGRRSWGLPLFQVCNSQQYSGAIECSYRLQSILQTHYLRWRLGSLYSRFFL